MISLRVVVPAVAGFLAGSRPAFATGTGHATFGGNFLFLPAALVLVVVVLKMRGAIGRNGFKATLENLLRTVVGIPLSWAALAGLSRLTGYPPASMLIPLWMASAHDSSKSAR